MIDDKFTVTEESTSRHPQDWGRAMAVAIHRLTELARDAGDAVHDEALLGEDLHLNVVRTDDGVNITMSWTPRDEEESTLALGETSPAGNPSADGVADPVDRRPAGRRSGSVGGGADDAGR